MHIIIISWTKTRTIYKNYRNVHLPKNCCSPSMKRWRLLPKTSPIRILKFCWYFVILVWPFFVDSVTCWAFLHKYSKSSRLSFSLFSSEPAFWQKILTGTTWRESFGTEVTCPWKEFQRNLDSYNLFNEICAMS